MSKKQPKAGKSSVLIFANVAHFYSHMMMLVFPTVVIVLEKVFSLPFGELLSLSLIGFVLYGIAALPAGWLGDRWSAKGMLAIFFVGTGVSGVAAGFATNSSNRSCSRLYRVIFIYLSSCRHSVSCCEC